VPIAAAAERRELNAGRIDRARPIEEEHQRLQHAAGGRRALRGIDERSRPRRFGDAVVVQHRDPRTGRGVHAAIAPFGKAQVVLLRQQAAPGKLCRHHLGRSI
jgi:hypothetical protein